MTAVCRCNAGTVLLRAVDGELSRLLTDKIDRMNHLAAGRHDWPIGTGWSDPPAIISLLKTDDSSATAVSAVRMS